MTNERSDNPEKWEPSYKRDVDSGWAWVVAFASFFIHAMTLGFAYGMGVFYVGFLDAFQESKAKTAWITSLNFCLLCGTGPLASILVERFGCRTTLAIGGFLSTVGFSTAALSNNVNEMLVTMGLIGGLGFGLCHVTNVVVIAHFFCKYRTLAQGLTFSGAGVGTVVYPWICRVLIDTYGWRGALLFCAGINFHIVALALLIPTKSPLERSWKAKSLESKDKMKQTPEKISTFKAILQYFGLFQSINFTLLCINNFFVQSGMYIVYTHLVAYALSLNFGKIKADLLISIAGVFNMFGRGGLGLIGQMDCVDVPQLYCVSFFIAGLSILGCGFWTSFPAICVCSSIFGFFCGAAGPLVAEFTCICVGLEDFSRGLGFAAVFMALGNLLGAPAAGLVYDLTKFYPASFYLGGVCLLVCALLIVPVLFNLRKSKKRHDAAMMVPVCEEEIPALS